MFQGLYVLWALLPLLFVGLWVWSLVKPWFGAHGKEDSRSYFSQAVFCSVAFAVAYFIDQKFILEMGEEALFGLIDVRILRWLLYPGVLVVMAYLQWLLFGKSVKSHSKFTGAAQAIR